MDPNVCDRMAYYPAGDGVPTGVVGGVIRKKYPHDMVELGVGDETSILIPHKVLENFVLTCVHSHEVFPHDYPVAITTRDTEEQSEDDGTPLKPRDGVVTSEICLDVIGLVIMTEEIPPLDFIKDWSQEDKDAVYDYCIREHLSASDNDGIKRKDRPQVLADYINVNTPPKKDD